MQAPAFDAVDEAHSINMSSICFRGLPPGLCYAGAAASSVVGTGVGKTHSTNYCPL